jgi:hypothetical protein
MAKSLQAWTDDPEGQELGASLNSATPSTTLVFGGTYSEIPL